MKQTLLSILLLLSAVLAAQPTMPITSYDYAIPENNVSPICIGMGALNVTNDKDFYGNYSNPALIGANQYSALLTSFRLKNTEDMTFLDAAQFSNILRPKQFKYFTLLAKQSAWTYQPVAAVHISEITTGSNYRYYDYQLDKLQVTLAAKDESWQPIAFGLNLKYLTGRLVYLISNEPTSFIDDKIRGVSADMGVTFQAGNLTFGLSSYDVLSRLWWENFDPVSITRRMSVGLQYATDNLTVLGGIQSKLEKETDATYHIGGQYLWDWSSTDDKTDEEINQGIVLRAGLYYTHDKDGDAVVHSTLGTGYNYNLFRFDFSVNNPGLKFKDGEYLFSLGVGLPE
jgi:hypothetical protein